MYQFVSHSQERIALVLPSELEKLAMEVLLPTFRSFGQCFLEYYLLHLLLVFPLCKKQAVTQKWNRASQS